MKPLGKLATLLVAMACALPAIAQSDETAKRFHVFPQLADGGGWQSFLLVTNAAQSSSFCAFELHGLSLDRFPEVSGITASGSTATFSLDGPGGYLTWRTKNESALATGYATLDCTAPTVAQVLYASRLAASTRGASVLLFPGGFTPNSGSEAQDMSFVDGIHGFPTDRFTWDVSGALGAHEADLFITDTGNASLGAFDLGRLR